MFDFSFKRGDYLIHAGERKTEPMWKSSPIPQFTQSELQQIQQVLREELKYSHITIESVYTTKHAFRKVKAKIKKLSALQTKVKNLTNL